MVDVFAPRAVYLQGTNYERHTINFSDANVAVYRHLGTIPVGNSPQEAAAFLDSEVQKWGKVVRDANVKIDN